MNVNIQREIAYTAKCYENVTMKLRNLTTSETKESIIFEPKEKNKKRQYQYNIDFMFDCMVSGITNLTVTDENKEVVKIETGKELLDNPGLNELYLELIPILIGMEAKVDSKN